MKNTVSVAAGILMVAAGIHFFLLPNNLALGGATGMVLLLSKIFSGIPKGALFLMVNIALFVLGFIAIGNKFGVKTILATVALSSTVWLFEIFLPVKHPFGNDIFLQLVTAVLLYGAGVGIVLNHYASTGGSDIIALILQKYTGTDLGKGCLITDFTITLCTAFAYSGETALFSLIGVIINGVVIDATINGLNTGRYCIINTEKADAICDFLVKMGRSGNIYTAKGAYTKKNQEVVQTVLSRKDFVKLKTFLAELDPNAFMVVTSAYSVFGYNWRKIKD